MFISTITKSISTYFAIDKRLHDDNLSSSMHFLNFTRQWMTKILIKPYQITFRPFDFHFLCGLFLAREFSRICVYAVLSVCDFLCPRRIAAGDFISPARPIQLSRRVSVLFSDVQTVHVRFYPIHLSCCWPIRKRKEKKEIKENENYKMRYFPRNVQC